MTSSGKLTVHFIGYICAQGGRCQQKWQSAQAGDTDTGQPGRGSDICVEAEADAFVRVLLFLF